MDLRLYFRVLWRFRPLLVLGFVLANALAFLSLMRVDLEGGSVSVSYREQEQWVSYARLFVTQRGFPWGQLTVPENSPVPVDGSGEDASATPVAPNGNAPVADPDRLTTLAILYSQLALSDQVRAIMLGDGPIEGKLEAAPVTSSGNSKGDPLPMISIAAIAPSPRASVSLARRQTDAFKEYIARQQVAGRVPTSNRVVLTTVKYADTAELYQGRPQTRPIVVFITVMLAVIGLAFMLANLRPAIRPVYRDALRLDDRQAESARSSA